MVKSAACGAEAAVGRRRFDLQAQRRCGDDVREEDPSGETIRVEKFVAEEKTVAETANQDVRTYIVGLKDWIIGTAHWVYQTDRYFRGKGNNVKTVGWVFLLPRGAES